MAPNVERRPDAVDGDGGEPPEGLVDVSQRTCLESGGLRQGGGAKNGCPVCAGKARPDRMERYRLTLADGAQRELLGVPKQNIENKEANIK